MINGSNSDRTSFDMFECVLVLNIINTFVNVSKFKETIVVILFKIRPFKEANVRFTTIFLNDHRIDQ